MILNDYFQYPPGSLSGNPRWTNNDEDPSMVVAATGIVRGTTLSDTGVFWQSPGANASNSRFDLTIQFNGSPTDFSDIYGAWGSGDRPNFFGGWAVQIVSGTVSANSAQIAIQCGTGFSFSHLDTRTVSNFTWGIPHKISGITIGSWTAALLDDVIVSSGPVTSADLRNYATGGSFSCFYSSNTPDAAQWLWSQVTLHCGQSFTSFPLTANVTMPYADGLTTTTGAPTWIVDANGDPSNRTYSSIIVNDTSQGASYATNPTAMNNVNTNNDYAVQVFFTNVNQTTSSVTSNVYLGDETFVAGVIALVINYNNNDQVDVSLVDSGGGAIAATGTHCPFNNNHNLLFNFVGPTTNLYLDGSLIGTDTGSFNKGLMVNGRLTLGFDGTDVVAAGIYAVFAYAPPTITSMLTSHGTMQVQLDQACSLLDATKFSIASSPPLTVTGATINGASLLLSFSGASSAKQAGTLTMSASAIKSLNAFLPNVSQSVPFNLPGIGTLSRTPVNFVLQGNQTETVGAATRQVIFPGPNLPHAGTYSDLITNGTGMSQGTTLCSIVGSATAPVQFILTNLTMSGLDEPVVLTGIKSILIQETSTSNNSNYLLVGAGNLTNAWQGPWSLNTQGKIGSTGCDAHNNPLGWVVNGSSNILQIAPSSGTVNYQIDIIGTQ